MIINFYSQIPFNGAFFKTLHQLLVGHRVDRLTLNKVGFDGITDHDRERSRKNMSEFMEFGSFRFIGLVK